MPEMHDGKDPWIMGLAGRWKMHGLHMQDGMGTANTSVAFHNKQLLALQETDFPYAVRLFQCFTSDARVISSHLESNRAGKSMRWQSCLRRYWN